MSDPPFRLIVHMHKEAHVHTVCEHVGGVRHIQPVSRYSAGRQLVAVTQEQCANKRSEEEARK